MQGPVIEEFPPEVSKAITFDDEHWVYFGVGEGWGPDRCSRCLKLIKRYRAPNSYCINC